MPTLSQTDARTQPETAAELDAILTAWHEATQRLQQTHETLRQEVAKLTAELEAKNRELARENRLADLGRMAAHVAHEVRNSLVPMTLYLSMLKRQMNENQPDPTIVDKLEAGFAALESTVNDLLHFTAGREPVWDRFELHSLVSQVCESIAAQTSAQGIAVEVNVAADIVVTADRNMLYRAILNVVLNSVDAMPDGGALFIRGRAEEGQVELEMADRGPGIDLDDPMQILEPFFTTKHDGTGLGLAIVEQILSAHHGSVRAGNSPQGGATLTFLIPQRPQEAAA